MILPWKNYLQTNEVSFELPNGIKYIAYPDGDYTIKKIHKDGKTGERLNESQWELEKQWISDNFSDIYGVYEPCTHDELEPDDDKGCYFGKTENGLYLDRIQRREEWMDNRYTHQIKRIPNWGILHTPDGGDTLYKIEWCESRGEFYNLMRCDVFPENPGWKKLDKAEALIELNDYLSFDDIQAIENKTFPKPQKNIIGTVVIP